EIRRVILMPRLVWNRHYPDLGGRNQTGTVSRDRSEDAAGAESALPSMLCLSRRRCTEDGIRIASRYFATVRRAISMTDSRNRSTMGASERIAAGASASINPLMW